MKKSRHLRGLRSGVAMLVVGGICAAASGPVHADPLPAGYGYELVSPPFTFGQAPTVGMIAPDGNGVQLLSPGAFADAAGAPDLGGAFYARRTDAGWRTVPLVPPATQFPAFETVSANGLEATADGRSVLWWLPRHEDKNSLRYVPVLSDADGNVSVVGPTFDETGASPVGNVVAASADLRTIVLQSKKRTYGTDGAPDTRSAAQMGLYVSRPDGDAPGGFAVRQVAFRAGAPMSATCSVQLGSARTARGAVSDDGRRIFFSFSGLTSCQTLATNQRVWVRDGAADPEDLSASLCTDTCGSAAPAYFEGAAYDGRRVYFTTEQKLLNTDLDDGSRNDLYVHDSAFPANNRLRNVTASGAAGQGAGVLGVVRVSDDGSYVTFVANGRPLAGTNARGVAPQAGDNNLYVYHRPRSPLAAPESIRFVGKLDAADDVNRGMQFSLLNAQNRPVNTSSDGRYLLFTAFSDLTGEKQPGDAQRDLFRYDAVTDELTRIWSDDPAHNGTQRTAGVRPNDIGPSESPFIGARQKQRRIAWMISDDGQTVAFATAERLSADDVNDRRDVYMWQAQTGAITMLTDGRSVRDQNAFGVSRGGDVFFASDAPLVPEHRSGAQAAYVARRGGGFASPVDPPVPCSGDACQGPLGQAPVVGGGAVTDRLAGSGNVLVSTVALTATAPKTVRGSRVSVRVRATGGGRLEVGGAQLKGVARSLSVDRQTSVRVMLSTAGRRTLARGRSVRVVLRVRLRATGGDEVTRRVAVTFRPTAAQLRRVRAAARREQA